VQENRRRKTILFYYAGTATSACEPSATTFPESYYPYEYPEEKVKEAMQKLKELHPWLKMER